MTDRPDDTAFAAVRDALGIVLEIDPSPLTSGTELAALGSDSLVLVSVADILETVLSRDGRRLVIDDSALAAVRTVGDLSDYAAGALR